jgi:hypothetical protein
MLLGMLLWFSASFGLQEYGEIYEHTYYEHSPVFAEIEIHAENEWLDIYGIYKNEMDETDTWMFAPQQDYFTVGATVLLKSVSFTFEHECGHPVGASPFEELSGSYSGYNKIFITFDSKK